MFIIQSLSDKTPHLVDDEDVLGSTRNVKSKDTVKFALPDKRILQGIVLLKSGKFLLFFVIMRGQSDQ